MFKPHFALLAAFAFTVCPVAVAQTPDPAPADLSPPVPSVFSTPCDPWRLQVLPQALSFSERVCIGLSQMASPGLFAAAGLAAGFSEWRNSPRMNPRDGDDTLARFAHIYERRAARSTAELFAGYLHREDPRFHFSNQQGTWRRTRATLFSVLTSADRDGTARVALVPIAGALGSGLTSMALYQRQNSLANGLERSGLVYSGYFARALAREFSPDLWSLAPHFIRKHRPDHFQPQVQGSSTPPTQ